MNIKKIYVHPGDMIEIRIIDDPELDRNKKEWSYQLRPESILLQYRAYKRIACSDPQVYFDYETFN